MTDIASNQPQSGYGLLCSVVIISDVMLLFVMFVLMIIIVCFLIFHLFFLCRLLHSWCFVSKQG